MSAPISDLVEIIKLNGNFKRNYGTLIRACSAARGRSFFWSGLLLGLVPAGTAFLQKHGLWWLRL
jgi:hypothetical protein